MGRLSGQPAVTDVTGAELLSVVVAANSGSSDPHKITAANFAASTALLNAFKDNLEALVAAGSGVDVAVDPTTGVMTISATAGGGSWDAEQTRDTIAAAATGTAGHVSVTPNDAGDLIVWDLDPAVVADIDALKAARSLIQAKENSSAGGSGNYMNFPGTTGNYIDTASNSAFNVAGDVGFAARVKMPASTPAGDITVKARWGSSNATGQFRCKIMTTGQLGWVSTVDGVNTSQPVTTAAVPLAFDGNWIWIRWNRQSSTGNVDFWTAPDTGSDNLLPASWTSFQANRATTAGALWNNSGTLSVPLSIGTYNAGASGLQACQIGRVLMYPNETLTGSAIADANAADYVSGSSWVGPASNTWSIHGTASVVQVGGGATFSTTSKFVLADTDANTLVPLAHRDIVYWVARGGIINTSGSSRTFTPELVVNNVVLSTFPAITVASSGASTVYRWECALTIEINSTDGTTQDYQWTLRIYDAATGTFLGSSSTTAIMSGGDLGGGNSVALSTFLTLPKIELKMTMSFSAATVGAGAALSHVSLQKA